MTELFDQEADTGIIPVYDQDVLTFDDPPPVEGQDPDDWEDEDADIELAAAKEPALSPDGAHVRRVQNTGWKPAAHPRLTTTTAGQRGGSFIDNALITKALNDLGRIDLSSLGAGSQHVAHVEIVKTQNQDQSLMKVGLHIQGQPGNYNVYFYVPTKNLQTERLQGMLQSLNNGLPVNDLVRKYKIHRVSKDDRYYNAYTQFVRTVASAKASKKAGFAEEGKVSHELAYIFCTESEIKAADDDGLVWKVALPVGDLKVHPVHGARRGFRVIEGRSSDQRQAIGLQDIVDSFEDGALTHVTVPLTHADRVDENTGFVKKIKIGRTKDGRPALLAAVDFTEPEIKGKVTRGTIANCSVGLEYDYLRKSDGKRYPVVLQHLNLTNKPWVPGMPAFGIAAAEDSDVTSLLPETDAELPTWNEERGLFWRLEKAEEAIRGVLEDASIRDLDPDIIVVANDDGKLLGIPYVITDDGIALQAREAWQEYRRLPLDDLEEYDELDAESPTRDPDATPLRGDPDDESPPWEDELLRPQKPADVPRPPEPPWGPTKPYTGASQGLAEAQARRRARLNL